MQWRPFKMQIRGI